MNDKIQVYVKPGMEKMMNEILKPAFAGKQSEEVTAEEAHATIKKTTDEQDGLPDPVTDFEEVHLLQNNYSPDQTCAGCGDPVRPLIPLWAFGDGDYGKPLCPDCIYAFSGSKAVSEINNARDEYKRIEEK